MGQANRAPKPFYERKFQISKHAVERFRQRVDEEFASRPDYDLMNLLDERIQNAQRSEDVIDHNHKDATTTLFVIEDRRGRRALAVVRENCCVTVLDEEMLADNVAKKTWTRALHTPFKDALAGVKPVSKAVLAPETGPAHDAVLVKRRVTPEPEAIDPVVVAGIAHAKALQAERVATVRMLDAERELEAARQSLEIAKDRRARAENDLHQAVHTASQPTPPITKENQHG
jgi:hypothetical protein